MSESDNWPFMHTQRLKNGQFCHYCYDGSKQQKHRQQRLCVVSTKQSDRRSEERGEPVQWMTATAAGGEDSGGPVLPGRVMFDARVA